MSFPCLFTSLISAEREALNTSKNELQKAFDQQEEAIITAFQDRLELPTIEKSMKIVQALGLLDSHSLFSPLTDILFSTKNKIETEAGSLAEQWHHNSVYEQLGMNEGTKKQELEVQLSSFVSTMKVLIDQMDDNLIPLLGTIEQTIKTTIEGNKTAIESIIQKENILSTTLAAYSDYEKLITKINEFFLGTQNSLHEILTPILSPFTEELKIMFAERTAIIKTSYPTLLFNDEMISDYTEATVKAYPSELEEYMNTMVYSIYDHDQDTMIRSTIEQLKTLYVRDNEINYKQLHNQPAFIDANSSRTETIKTVIAWLSSQEILFNPDQQKKNIQERLSDFHQIKKREYSSSITSFLEEQAELLTIKAKEQRSRLEKLMTSVRKRELMKTGTNKETRRNELITSLEEIYNDAASTRIQKDSVEHLEKLGWNSSKDETQEYEEIFVQPAEDTLDMQIRLALEAYKQKFIDEFSLREWQARHEELSSKITSLLWSFALTDTTKYYLLKIAKQLSHLN